MVVKGDGTVRLAKLLEKLSTIRARFRKGKTWLRLGATEEGDVVIDTSSIVNNVSILTTLLKCCGLKVPTVDEMTQEVW